MAALRMAAVPSAAFVHGLVAEIAGNDVADRAVSDRIALWSLGLDPFTIMEIETTLAGAMGLGRLLNVEPSDPTVFDLISAFFAADLEATAPAFLMTCNRRP